MKHDFMKGKVIPNFNLKDPAHATHQRALQIKGLGILTEQHHILLQVVQAAILMAADPLLKEVSS